MEVDDSRIRPDRVDYRFKVFRSSNIILKEFNDDGYIYFWDGDRLLSKKRWRKDNDDKRNRK